MLIVRAEDPGAAQREVAGGKGAALARLTRAGFNVPPFFTVTVQAFNELHNADLTDHFLDELRAAYEDLGGASGPVAVRSSATSEDAASGSSAGIYETHLGVSDFQELINALHDCWKSLDNPAAVQYRSDQAQDSAGMAVVIQRQIDGDWSGVTFTAHPVNMSLSQMVINAIPGMGEALVGGQTNPEQIVIDVESGSTLSQSSGDARDRIPREFLGDVWSTGKDIAAAFGCPQDIEWTIRGKEHFILQSRPVTTIAGIFYNRFIEPWRGEPDVAEDPDVIWTRAYGDEVWTSPESPLNYSVRNPPGASAGWFGGYLPTHGDTRPLPPACAKTFMSAAYANIDVLRRVYEYHPKVARIAGVLNFFPLSMQEEIRTMPWRWRGRLRRHWQLERKDRAKSSLGHNHQYLETLSAPLVDVSDRWFDTDLDTLTLEELRSHLANEVMPQVLITGTYYAIGVMYHSFDLTFILTGLLERWFGNGDVLYARVSSGLPDSATVAEAQAIWELTNLARASGPLGEERLRASNWKALFDDATLDPHLRPFVDAFAAFLRDHRHRGAAYKDIMFPRWGDQPDLLLELIKSSLGSQAESPATQNVAQGAERRRQQTDLLRRCRLHPIRWATLRWLFHYNEIYMAIRNDHRYYFDRLWYERRRVYVSMGQRLVAAAVLDEEDDVFFLGTNEVDAALAGELGREEIYRRVDVRRLEWEATLMTQAPKFLRGYSPMPDELAVPEHDVLTGIAASPGVARGPARVIFRIEELGQVQDGDILVTRQTDPGWTPVFSKISGLVLETGGVLAHGTSLSREYGLPCVTVVERATNRISTGSPIEIDGSTGKISLLSPETI